VISDLISDFPLSLPVRLLYYRACLHEDVVLGQEERGDLGQFSDGRAVCVRYDGSELVQGVI